jgi:hypothetical protein
MFLGARAYLLPLAAPPAGEPFPLYAATPAPSSRRRAFFPLHDDDYLIPGLPPVCRASCIRRLPLAAPLAGEPFSHPAGASFLLHSSTPAPSSHQPTSFPSLPPPLEWLNGSSEGHGCVRLVTLTSAVPPPGLTFFPSQHGLASKLQSSSEISAQFSSRGRADQPPLTEVLPLPSLRT